MTSTFHAVHRLFQERLASSTKPFKARGGRVNRCELCRLDLQFCSCSLRPEAKSNCGFMLIYYDDEVLKPSNTGRLIADLFEHTFAYIWHRTEPNPEMLAVLKDSKWQPVVVFPENYCLEPREVYKDEVIPVSEGKRLLFILLDGSWREAKKMFRKSHYLSDFPVLSITPEKQSSYRMRKAAHNHQLATAEVASYALMSQGEMYNGRLLSKWFDVFNFRYLQGVKQSRSGDPGAEELLRDMVKRE